VRDGWGEGGLRRTAIGGYRDLGARPMTFGFVAIAVIW